VLPHRDAERGRLLVQLGVALNDGGRLADAEIALGEAGAVADGLGDAALDARVAVEALILDLQLDPAAAVARAQEATGAAATAFGRAADDEGLTRLAYLVALVHWMEGRVASAESSWVRAAELARRRGDMASVSDALRWIPSAAAYGPMPVGKAIVRCAEVLADLPGSRRAEADTLGPLAALYAMHGDVDHARGLVARHDAVIEEVGFAMHSVGEWAAQVELLAGDACAAEAHLRDGYARLEEIGERGFLSTTAALLARALQAQGRDDDALEFTGVCEETAAPEDLAAQIAWRGVRARVLAARQQTAEAVTLANEAVALAKRTDLVSDHGDVLLDLTECLRAAGRSVDATEAALEARTLYESKGNTVGADRAQAVLDELVPA
jgi:tetratricopeptide (TPR) repeat protein